MMVGGIESIIINAFITIFALGLFIVSFASYRKYKNVKLIFVSLVFLVLLCKGLLLSLSLFVEGLPKISNHPYVGLFDLLILIFLFTATLKR